MLGTAELASMRTTVGTTLRGTAFILRASNVDDEQGGYTTTWGTAGTVSCHLSPATIRSGEEQLAGRIATEASHILTCAHNTDIRTTDRVRESSVEYEVLSVSTPRTWALSTRADIKKVD
jgi:SPP1 family predicted phage head-tail adaptor